MIDELVDTGVVGADVGFGELPEPGGGGVDGRSENTLGAFAVVGGGRETKFDGDGFKGAERCLVEYGPSCVGFSAVLRVDPINEWQVRVVEIQHEKFLLFQRLNYIYIYKFFKIIN